MRTCPHCSHELPDEGTACPRCGHDLSARTAAEPEPGGAWAPLRYTHSGERYVLGYGEGFFGIWDRWAPGAPAERFPRTDDGWRQAWTRYASLEPRFVEVPREAGLAAPPPPPGPKPTASEPAAPARAIRYTHSGERYVLGYGEGFFGIWDRWAPGAPAERFPRTDDGWRQAWTRFSQLEPDAAEVRPEGEPGTQTSGPATGRGMAEPGSGVAGGWWLLPLLFGLLGGTVAWLATRRRDPRTAALMLAAGALTSGLAMLLYATAVPR